MHSCSAWPPPPALACQSSWQPACYSCSCSLGYVESWYYLPISKWIDKLIAHGYFIHQAPNVQLEEGAASWQDGEQGTHLIRIIAPAQPTLMGQAFTVDLSMGAAVRMVTHGHSPAPHGPPSCPENEPHVSPWRYT